MASRSFRSKVICYKKDDCFLAVALDFDLMVQGKTMGEAMDRIDDNIRSYLKMCLEDNEIDKQIYRRASKKYYDLYDLFLELGKKRTEKGKTRYKEQCLANLTFNKASLVNV